MDDQSENYIASVANLPTNKYVLKVLTNNSSEPAVEDQDKIKINEFCVVCWDDGNGDYIWYLVYLKEQNGRFYTIDHLKREIDTNKLWKYPIAEDIQVAEQDQILNVKVNGYWDFSDLRGSLYYIQNEKEICFNFIQVFNRKP